ncbi:MAG: Smr/MutS family protein [Flavobacteriales bacterium]
MAFREGERVDLLDEAGSGRITRFLTDGRAMVELEDGFEFAYPQEKLVKREESLSIPYESDEAFFQRVREKEGGGAEPARRSSPPKEKLEIDLHIEELIDRPMLWDNSEILIKQVDYCRAQIQRAIRDRIPRVIIIHGVGEGVLKSAVRDMLDREYPELLYFDAPMQEYGRGATELRLG